MKTKLRDYIDSIFADAPICAKTIDLKDEMYRNVCDRYDDLIREGKSESAAYNICIAGIGDVSEIIDGLRAERGDETSREGENVHAFEREYSPEEQEKIERYRMRSGIMNAIAIALYILCWVPLVLITSILEFNGMNSDVGGIIGITVMMVMIAVASGLFIMRRYMRPTFLKNKKYAKLQKEAQGETKKHRNPALRIISRIVWAVALAVFLILGFSRGLWHPAWILFPLAVALDNIVEAIFELCGKKYV